VFQDGAQTNAHHFMVIRYNDPHASPYDCPWPCA